MTATRTTCLPVESRWRWCWDETHTFIWVSKNNCCGWSHARATQTQRTVKAASQGFSERDVPHFSRTHRSVAKTWYSIPVSLLRLRKTEKNSTLETRTTPVFSRDLAHNTTTQTQTYKNISTWRAIFCCHHIPRSQALRLGPSCAVVCHADA